tara:strand:+ start:8734 stop:10014 length:1281 start_codon:yes stop_codon:yes gene_type:complete
MTAEVAIVNTMAVALAADSAVTITLPTGETKIYNTVEKLFRLSEQQPIALMVYGAGSFASVSWELLAKQFRADNKDNTFITVDECIAHFIDFLKRRTDIVSNAQRSNGIKLIMNNVFHSLQKEALSKFEEEDEFDDADVKHALTLVLEKEISNLSGISFRNGESDETVESCKEQVSEIIPEVYSRYFDGLVDDVVHSKLVDFTGLYLAKGHQSLNVTGLVFAGFGSNEYVPNVKTLNFIGAINEHVIYNEVEGLSYSGLTPSSIIPFAQSDVLLSFIKGLSPTLNTSIESITRESSVRVLDSVKEFLSTKGIQQQDIEDYSSELFGLLFEERRRVLNDITASSNDKLVSPIIGMLSYLPKDELAKMAESLVNMTAFRRKVSNEDESVGGPIDVAVLTKNDGFVWIKRKHYFPSNLNDHFFNNRCNN